MRKYRKVLVSCINNPRNNIGNWKIRSISWNGKSNGTLNNALNLLEQGKKTRLYLKQAQKFYSIIKLKDFEGLLNDCDSEDLKKIDKKIRLYERINVLSQGTLFDIQRKSYDKTKEDNLLLALEEGQYEVGGE